MKNNELNRVMGEVAEAFDHGVKNFSTEPDPEEIGKIKSVGQGIAWATGLSRVKSEELVFLGNGIPGMALDILPESIGFVLFGPSDYLHAGDEIIRSKRVLDLPVGESLIGRVIDPLGKPMDDMGPVVENERWPAMQEAPRILARAPVDKPLQTGLKVIDSLIPIGRGQRELILGDRQTGKTAIAVDTIINQKDKDVICVYCAIGQRNASTAKVIDELRQKDALRYSIVVVVAGDDPPGLQYIAPYAATTIAEYFMHKGRDVLIIYDDLTKHAIAYRQLSLLLRRPPGREAFPGDIFYIHSRLLERATHLKAKLGGGSLTALPIAETEAQNISAYIPTNLISITDGQIYLSPDLFQKGVLPAVDVGKSVSRVGGRAQVAAYRLVAGDLRLSYTQFQELESFSRFGTRLDARTQKTLEHGKRVREALKQESFSPLSIGAQIAVLSAVTHGLFDDIPLGHVKKMEKLILENIYQQWADIDQVLEKAKPESDFYERLLSWMTNLIETVKGNNADPGITQ